MLSFAAPTPDGDGLHLRLGADETAATRAIDAFKNASNRAMWRLGARLALKSKTIAETAAISPERAEAVLSFFTTTRAAIGGDYYVPLPSSPLKVRPLLTFESRWLLPSAMLFLPAVQPALERALNPAFKAPSGSAADWDLYAAQRADLLERRAVGALSTLLNGAPAYRNLKYKSIPGMQGHDELDGLILADTVLILIEGKAGGFTATARRGDIDAIEGRIKELITDAHTQALRAKAYIDTQAAPTFRLEDGTSFVLNKTPIDEILLITVTFEELGVLTGTFNDVRRINTASASETPWAVPLHDLEIIARYLKTAPEFVHFLRRRIAMNHAAFAGAFDELDWLGRYFYDSLTFADLKHIPGSANVWMQSHTTDFDSHELFRTGIRDSEACAPEHTLHSIIAGLCAALQRWSGHNYINGGVALLDLPPKLQRSFGKRIAASLKRRRDRLVQEVASASDRSIRVCCSLISDGVATTAIKDIEHFGSGEYGRDVHLIVNHRLEVLDLRWFSS